MTNALRPAILLTAFLASATAGAAPPLSLTAVRETPDGREQVSLVFRADKVELVTNSDFLLPAYARRTTRVLGVLESPRNDWTGEAEDLAKECVREIEVRARLTERVNAALPPDAPEGATGRDRNTPHAVRIFVGTEELPDSAASYRRVSALLGQAALRAGWKPRDAVELTPADSGKVKLKPLGESTAKAGTFSLAELQCAPGGPRERRRCPVPGYGTHWFRP